MEKNIGKTDATIRTLIGGLAVGYAISQKNWWGLLGVIPILTAMTGYCPVNKMLNINTDELENNFRNSVFDHESEMDAEPSREFISAS